MQVERLIAVYDANRIPGAELDVQLSRDGELVVIHDAAVDRTTDGHGQVAAMTLAQLRALNAGVRHGAHFQGARIPTLRDTLAWARGRTELVVEIKQRAYMSLGYTKEQAAKLLATNGVDEKGQKVDARKRGDC